MENTINISLGRLTDHLHIHVYNGETPTQIAELVRAELVKALTCSLPQVLAEEDKNEQPEAGH